MERITAKEEEAVISCSTDVPATAAPSSPSGTFPQPREGLHDAGPPPFLTKTYEMVEDPASDPIVSWSQGFRKVDPDRWEFANEGFLGGQKHLLKTIRRRRNVTQGMQHQGGGPCVEVGQYGLEGELERLHRDRTLLMNEIVKLRQEQQNSREQIMTMEARLQSTERKQQQMMAFLAKALTNPSFVQNLVGRNRALGGIDTGRKRRLTASPSTETMREEVISAVIGDTQVASYPQSQPQERYQTAETHFETMLSSAMDNESSSDFKDPVNVGNVPSTSKGPPLDNPSEVDWEELLGEGLNPEEAALGDDPSEVDIKVEDLVAIPSDWGEDLRHSFDQSGFLR